METRIFEITSPTDEKIDEVADILKKGGIVAVPTETVYGLAGNALDGSCVRKIFEAKGRPNDNPLIVHISDISQWAPLVKHIPESAMALAEKFWPGPLTIILNKSDLIPIEVSGGLDTVGVRMPSNEVTKSLIEKAGVPLAAPSANLSGKPSPTAASHVIDDLYGKVDGIVCSGDCSVGIESTVISLATVPPRIFRPGGISPEEIAEVLGEVVVDDAVTNALKEGEKAASPGMKYKHYSPEAKVYLLKGSFEKYKRFLKENAKEGTFALCFEGEEKELNLPLVTYGKKGDAVSQAKHIFDALRQLDKLNAKEVYVRFPESDGVGLGVFNRLLRAAAFNIIEL
ncbi:MAG: L-threonylcarbamoyladenylate synthase [Acutalibacteraceae bacterium]